MVGVPSSKGCGLCVKRRVKCNQERPGNSPMIQSDKLSADNGTCGMFELYQIRRWMPWL